MDTPTVPYPIQKASESSERDEATYRHDDPGSTSADVSTRRIKVSFKHSADEEFAQRFMRALRFMTQGLEGQNVSRPEIEVLGEQFYLEREFGYYYLTHPQWSLTGVGTDLVSAQDNLIEAARRVAGEYIHERPTNLTLSALRLRQFISKALQYEHSRSPEDPERPEDEGFHGESEE